MSQHSQKYSNPDRFFQTEHLKNDLQKHTVRGGAITLSSQILKFTLQTGGTFLLARLLVPSDFGLIGMVTIILNFVELFKDLGLSTATVQKDQINHAQVSLLFWINLAFSVAVTAIVAAMAPLVAWFYQEPRLTSIVLVLSANFILGGLAVQHVAILQRRMQFGLIAQSEIVSMVVGVLAAMGSALGGAGYWSLVIWRLAQSVTVLICVWIALPWRPGWVGKASGMASMLAFGGNITGFNVLNYFSRNFDNFLIGRYWGAEQLGLYAMAYKILLMPIQQINAPITNVAIPVLSRLQEEPEKYRRYYYKAVLAICTFGVPVVAFMFATADQIVLLMLGQDWLGVIPIFRWLTPAAYIGAFNVATGWVYISLGRVDRQLYWIIPKSIFDVILFAISVQWGAIGVAAAYGIAQPLIRIPEIFYCYRGTPLTVAGLAEAIWIPTLASLGAVLVVIASNHFLFVNLSVFISFILSTILFFFIYLLIWILLPNGRNTLTEILNMVQMISNRTKQS